MTTNPNPDRTETGPARKGSTERCANPDCGHTKRDHSGRRDHTTKHPNIPLRPWCHACESDCLYEPPAAAVSVVPPATNQTAPVDRAAVLREAAEALGRMDYDTDSNDYGYDTYRDAWNGGVMDGADLLRRLADEAAVVPPPALTEEGRLRAQVEVLQQDAERDQGLAKVGARCMREGHQGLIEQGRLVLEGWRFALSTALDLGTGAPWEAIHERAKELAAEAPHTETPDALPSDGTHPCGHDDYHDSHEWADRPGVWCPGIGYDEEPAVVAQPGKETAAEDPPVVAYRSDGGRLLNCLRHVPPPAARHADFHPVTSEDLPDGGICTYPDCGVDVLIAAEAPQ